MCKSFHAEISRNRTGWEGVPRQEPRLTPRAWRGGGTAQVPPAAGADGLRPPARPGPSFPRGSPPRRAAPAAPRGSRCQRRRRSRRAGRWRRVCAPLREGSGEGGGAPRRGPPHSPVSHSRAAGGKGQDRRRRGEGGGGGEEGGGGEGRGREGQRRARRRAPAATRLSGEEPSRRHPAAGGSGPRSPLWRRAGRRATGRAAGGGSSPPAEPPARRSEPPAALARRIPSALVDRYASLPVRAHGLAGAAFAPEVRGRTGTHRTNKPAGTAAGPVRRRRTGAGGCAAATTTTPPLPRLSGCLRRGLQKGQKNMCLRVKAENRKIKTNQTEMLECEPKGSRSDASKTTCETSFVIVLGLCGKVLVVGGLQRWLL
ncbi:uncharacterized protein LOC142028696 [Buteo buteo]|uniref:uncharacterized protein LOC142028696 n=1 Tax=Buteo buteo TaxID=30397 RepID=UPI003EB6DC8B